MAEDLYLKRAKTKGINYYKVFRRVPDGKDEYVRMAGTAEAINAKLVLLEKLKGQDQQMQQIRDQLSKSEEKIKKDQHSSIDVKRRVLEGGK